MIEMVLNNHGWYQWLTDFYDCWKIEINNIVANQIIFWLEVFRKREIGQVPV